MRLFLSFAIPAFISYLAVLFVGVFFGEPIGVGPAVVITVAVCLANVLGYVEGDSRHKAGRE